MARSAHRRYGGAPAAVLMAQLFLAFGWLRAGVAHSIERAWWSGEEILVFLETRTESAVWIYRPFLDYVVEPLPAATAAIVGVMEVAIGILLALNIKPFTALLVGVFLNLHFIMAGVVNPSAFYLVLALVVVLWRMERTLSLITSRKMSRVAAMAAVVLTLAMVPSISDPSPANAIEDPALVLIFIGILSAAATWWTYERIAID